VFYNLLFGATNFIRSQTYRHAVHGGLVTGYDLLSSQFAANVFEILLCHADS